MPQDETQDPPPDPPQEEPLASPARSEYEAGIEQDSQELLPNSSQALSPTYPEHNFGDEARSGHNSQPNSSLPLPVPNERRGDKPDETQDLLRSRSMSNSLGSLSRQSSDDERAEVQKGMKSIGKGETSMLCLLLVQCLLCRKGSGHRQECSAPDADNDRPHGQARRQTGGP